MLIQPLRHEKVSVATSIEHQSHPTQWTNLHLPPLATKGPVGLEANAKQVGRNERA
ncbi:hypothetical protein RISK_003644 [Rhodopirellula islandica]|uniref:Uncharacterized protein n=1 Tax=Rhodopirellula islandica TaxID=595434 RepID=A0A0J1BDG2_RHOIS|nr:hypothetical protein RISK_003644 [Rhodopirellula islandica]